MKKIIIIALTLFFTDFPFGGEKQVVEAKIKNLKDKEIVVKIYDIAGRDMLLDTVINCKNGQFSFNKQFSEPVFASFIPKSGLIDTKTIRQVVPREAMTIELYILENEKYSVTGSVDGNSIAYNVEGSEMNSVTSKLKTKYLQGYVYRDMEDEYFRDNRSKQDRDSVYVLGENILKGMTTDKFEYLKAHLDSPLSGLFLSEQSYAIFDEYYIRISDEVKNGLFKSQIDTKKRYADLVRTSRKMVAGADAIDFSLTGLDGDSITLSSLKGQYVLLYFWGSW